MKRFIESVLAATCAFSLLFGTGITRAEGDAADAAMQSIRPEAISCRHAISLRRFARRTGNRKPRLRTSPQNTWPRSSRDGIGRSGRQRDLFPECAAAVGSPNEAKTTVTLVRGGKEETLVFRKDFIAGGDPSREDTSVEAPVVYVEEE